MLETASLTFRYPHAPRPALDGLSLALVPGTVTWLAGAPGAGTSTLLLVAAGLAPMHTGGEVSGTCRLLGEDTQAPAGRAAVAGRVAYVSADPASQLSGIADTVEDEVSFAPANLGWARARIHAAAAAAMEDLGIAALFGRHPASLSGGEQQRVVLASMRALQPDVWLLDEPGSALDAQGRGVLAGLLASEARRGALVVVASEDADWMAGFADRLVILANGRVVRDGPPPELLADPTLPETGIGSTGAATFAAALADRDPGFAGGRLPITVSEALARWA